MRSSLHPSGSWSVSDPEELLLEDGDSTDDGTEWQRPREWRFVVDGNGATYMFIDPLREDVVIRALTAPERADMVDSVVSVSGLRRLDYDGVIDGCEVRGAESFEQLPFPDYL